MLPFFKKRVFSSSKKISVNLNKLKELLNGENNIIDVTFTHNKIKIFLKSTQKLDLNAIKKLKGITGIFIANNYITIIVGKQAKKLSSLLIKK